MTDPQRIIDTPDDVYFTEIDVTDSWSNAETADDDLRDALGVNVGTNNRAVYYQFWEGEDDPDDFASLRLPASAAASWADYFNNACIFSSVPSIGSTAYFLCGIVKDA